MIYQVNLKRSNPNSHNPNNKNDRRSTTWFNYPSKLNGTTYPSLLTRIGSNKLFTNLSSQELHIYMYLLEVHAQLKWDNMLETDLPAKDRNYRVLDYISIGQALGIKSSQVGLVIRRIVSKGFMDIERTGNEVTYWLMMGDYKY